MFLKRLLTTTTMVCALAAPVSAAVFDVSITFDDYPADISWTVKNLLGSTFGSGGGYNNATLGSQTVTASIDLANDDYVFEIFDSYGDGLCCNEGTGGYTLSLYNSAFFTSSGRFGTTESVAFGVSAVPLPAGLPLLLAGLISFGTMARSKRNA